MKLSVLALLTPLALASAADWPQWFGPDRDGVWRESGIVETFPASGPEVLWRMPIHQGYAAPAVSGGKVFAFHRKPSEVKDASSGLIPGDERLSCFDSKSGKLLWEVIEDRPYTVSYASGPRATPTVDGDRVYTLGAEGHLTCRKVEDGTLAWQKDFTAAYGAKTPTWGYAGSPLIDGDQLICLANGAGSIAVSYDKYTGKELWRALSAKEPGYCPPRIITHAGKRLLIIWHPESVNALDPETGTPVWTFPWKIRAGLTIATPQPTDNGRLFLASFYNGSLLLQLQSDHSTPKALWQTEDESEKRTTHLNPIINTPIIHLGHIYGACSYGEFRCLELASGKRIWESAEPIALKRPSRWGTVFVTPHEDRFFLFTEKGDLAIANLTPEGYEEISRANILKPDGADMRQRKIVWAAPAFADKCCFVRNDSEIVCVSLAGRNN